MKNKILLILLLLISIFIVVGCIPKNESKKETKKTKEKVNVENEKDIYIKYVK